MRVLYHKVLEKLKSASNMINQQSGITSVFDAGQVYCDKSTLRRTDYAEQLKKLIYKAYFFVYG
jgi:hypothetical protein